MRQSARICRCCNVSEWSAQRVRKYEGRKKGEEKGSRGRVGGRSREAKESKWPGRNGDQRRRGNTEPRREGRALSLSLSLSLLALSRPSRRAVVRFGPHGCREYERPNYENGPVWRGSHPCSLEIASSNKHTTLANPRDSPSILRRLESLTNYTGSRGWGWRRRESFADCQRYENSATRGEPRVSVSHSVARNQDFSSCGIDERDFFSKVLERARKSVVRDV